MTVEVQDLAQYDETFWATASDQDKADFRNWFEGVLKEHDVTVVFEKTNGDLRTMKCKAPEGAAFSESVATVWDIEKEDWRAFKFANLKSINFSLAG